MGPGSLRPSAELARVASRSAERSGVFDSDRFEKYRAVAGHPPGGSWSSPSDDGRSDCDGGTG